MQYILVWIDAIFYLTPETLGWNVLTVQTDSFLSLSLIFIHLKKYYDIYDQSSALCKVLLMHAQMQQFSLFSISSPEGISILSSRGYCCQ